MRFPSTPVVTSVCDQVHEQPVHPGVAAHLRVERRRQQVPLPDRDDPTGGRARRPPGRAPRPPGPTSSTHGARMKTACTGSASPANARSPSKESTCRPNALRRTVTSSPPIVSWPGTPSSIRSASRIIPAQVPNAGIPSAIRLPQRLEQVEGPGQLGHRRRLAARQHQPVARRRARAGRRTATARTPSPSSIRRCSRTSPCRARTPTVGAGSPAALGEPVRLRDVVDVDADHRLAQAAARPWRPRRGRRRTWWP